MNPRPEIDELNVYTPGTSLHDAARALGHDRIVKLASNESLWGPSPKAVEAATESLSSIRYYPAMQSDALVRALANTHQLSPDTILVGNGADEILRILATAYCDATTSIVYPSPSFSAYAHSARLAGATLRPVPLTADGRNDLPAILDQVDASTRLIYLCSPNNPTGGSLRRREWEAFLAAVPKTVLVVVDGAYQEFENDQEVPNFLEAVRHGDPVVVVRTFSKLYALAGLRVGWASAPAEVIVALKKTREPFSLNAVGAEAATASLSDSQYFSRVRQETLNARTHFLDLITRRGIDHFPSQANFVTIKSVDGDAELTARRLLEKGFVVRPTTNFGLPGYLRVTMAPINILEEFMAAWDQL